jgi:hypothetical protein
MGLLPQGMGTKQGKQPYAEQGLHDVFPIFICKKTLAVEIDAHNCINPGFGQGVTKTGRTELFDTH